MIKTLESVCCIQQYTYKITFYNEEKGGVEQSHGLSYLATRNFEKENFADEGEMGLDKIVPPTHIITPRKPFKPIYTCNHLPDSLGGCV